MNSDSTSDSFDNPISKQRRRWFDTEMDKQRQAYLYDKELNLFAGTWNVCGKGPAEGVQIDKWLFPVQHRKDRPFDIYMLGLQEIQNLSGVDAVRTDARRGEQWRSTIKKTLGSDYEQVAERQLVGILVVVLMRKNHVPYLSNVQLSYAATGVLNAVGNKGGVAARFQLYDKTISCVACHLAAHTEFVQRRNQDFENVVRKAVFLPDNPSQVSKSNPSNISGNPAIISGVGSSADWSGFLQTKRSSNTNAAASFGGLPSVAEGASAWLGSVASVAATAISDMSAGANTVILNDPNAVRILQHDVVFWLGDLNYRIDASLANVMKWIEEENWHELYDADQLQKQMKTCSVFTGFKEGPIRFPPTYKMSKSEDKYKVSGENGDKIRVPAYTDRILWRFGENSTPSGTLPRMKLQNYTSPIVYSSDHRPVYASFRMVFGIEDVKRKQHIEDKVNRELDGREASLRPTLLFSPTIVDFGDVFFERNCSRQFSIKNNGDSTAYLTVSLPSDTPEWFKFDPSPWHNFEIPSGKSVQLNFGILITGKDGSANDMPRNGCKLNTSVRVHAEPGSLRQRIQVRGRYVVTTLGLSLETLSMLERSVLALRNPTERELERLTNMDRKEPGYHREREREREPDVVPRAIPKEIWLLVNALLKLRDSEQLSFATTCPDLFLRSGDEALTQRVLSFVDRSERIPPDLSGYAVGSCMLQILGNLSDPVVPRKLYRRVLEAGHSMEPELVQGVLDLLPPLNSNVFWYIVDFLCDTKLVKGPENARALAGVFGNVLLTPHGAANSERDHRRKTDFMMEAFSIQKSCRDPAHRVFLDLSPPASHPKRINSGSFAG